MCADFKQILNVWRIDCRPSRYFTDALASALSECPQATQTNSAWLLRLRLSTFPHFAQVREVLRGSTSLTGTPTLCLVQNKALQLVEGPTVQTAALFLTSPYPTLIPLRSSRAIPRPVRCAAPTIFFEIMWFVSVAKRRSFRFRRRINRLAPLVPLF